MIIPTFATSLQAGSAFHQIAERPKTSSFLLFFFPSLTSFLWVSIKPCVCFLGTLYCHIYALIGALIMLHLSVLLIVITNTNKVLCYFNFSARHSLLTRSYCSILYTQNKALPRRKMASKNFKKVGTTLCLKWFSQDSPLFSWFYLNNKQYYQCFLCSQATP
jgi:hypothetical protein